MYGMLYKLVFIFFDVNATNLSCPAENALPPKGNYNLGTIRGSVTVTSLVEQGGRGILLVIRQSQRKAFPQFTAQ